MDVGDPRGGEYGGRVSTKMLRRDMDSHMSDIERSSESHNWKYKQCNFRAIMRSVDV